MNKILVDRIKKILLVILLYTLHFVALYTATHFIVTQSLFLRIIFVIAVVSLCLSVIVGWLFVADDFREAFLRYKKASPEADPSSEFTIFAPIRFIIGLFLWPYLAVFLSEVKVLPKDPEPIVDDVEEVAAGEGQGGGSQ